MAEESSVATIITITFQMVFNPLGSVFRLIKDCEDDIPCIYELCPRDISLSDCIS